MGRIARSVRLSDLVNIGLQGGLLAIPWRHLPEEITLRLLSEVDVW